MRSIYHIAAWIEKELNLHPSPILKIASIAADHFLKFKEICLEISSDEMLLFKIDSHDSAI